MSDQPQPRWIASQRSDLTKAEILTLRRGFRSSSGWFYGIGWWVVGVIIVNVLATQWHGWTPSWWEFLVILGGGLGWWVWSDMARTRILRWGLAYVALVADPDNRGETVVASYLRLRLTRTHFDAIIEVAEGTTVTPVHCYIDQYGQVMLALSEDDWTG